MDGTGWYVQLTSHHRDYVMPGVVGGGRHARACDKRRLSLPRPLSLSICASTFKRRDILNPNLPSLAPNLPSTARSLLPGANPQLALLPLHDSVIHLESSREKNGCARLDALTNFFPPPIQQTTTRSPRQNLNTGAPGFIAPSFLHRNAFFCLAPATKTTTVCI